MKNPLTTALRAFYDTAKHDFDEVMTLTGATFGKALPEPGIMFFLTSIGAVLGFLSNDTTTGAAIGFGCGLTVSFVLTVLGAAIAVAGSAFALAHGCYAGMREAFE